MDDDNTDDYTCMAVVANKRDKSSKPRVCGKPVNKYRYDLGYTTCPSCGEAAAKMVRHTVVPMHKSNYMVVTDRIDLQGINNKGGFHR